MRSDRESELAELLKEVRRIEVQSRRLVTTAMAGGYTSVFRGSGIEFEEVREYVDATLGDSSENTWFEVDAEQALGLPEPAIASA